MLIDIQNKIDEKLLYLKMKNIDIHRIQNIYNFRLSNVEKYKNFVFLEDYTFPCYSINTTCQSIPSGISISDIWNNTMPIIISGKILNSVTDHDLNHIMDFIPQETTLEDITIKAQEIDMIDYYLIDNNNHESVFRDYDSWPVLSFPTKELAANCLIDLMQQNVDKLKNILTKG